MHIVYLKFGPQRAHASQWMQSHVEWIQQGIDEGVFLMTGSLSDGQGGVVLAAHLERSVLEARVQLDPFVIHGVVTVDIHSVTPGRMTPGLAALLDSAQAAAHA